MPELYGKHHRRDQLLRRVGNMDQVAGIREYTYNSGRADGVKAVEVNCGDLRFELLPGRCLDISAAAWRGYPLGYHSKSGIRHPAYYSKIDPSGFQDNFLGGVLTTCGLHNIGPAAEGGGRSHQLHGELANMPAERLSVRETWDSDECTYSVEGEVRHAAFYHEDLLLRRCVSARMGCDAIVVEDEVENRDFSPSPCLVLYHVQFGFPFLDDESMLITSPIERSETRDRDPVPDGEPFHRFAPPRDDAEEICYYHTLRPAADGTAFACLFNPMLGDDGLGVYVRYAVDTLPLLVQWKMLRSREYVCGLEPATARLDDRSDGETAACLLQPLEKRRFRLEIGVVEGYAACLEL